MRQRRCEPTSAIQAGQNIFPRPPSFRVHTLFSGSSGALQQLGGARMWSPIAITVGRTNGLAAKSREKKIEKREKKEKRKRKEREKKEKRKRKEREILFF